jgi:arginase
VAVKIVRQPKKIALIGAPVSAAALKPGHERAPAVLRAAGLVAALQSVGYEVTDMGDCQTQISQPDDEHPRARNIPPLVFALNDLRPRIEIAVKSGALPLIIGGDCSIVLATVAGARRYFRHVGVIYVDRSAEMNVPATTPSGNVDGMTVSHLVGRGAPELVRFWGEPPLVREPDVVLFGTGKLDPPERLTLERSPIRRYMLEDIRRMGVTAAAEAAANRMQPGQHEFVLHFDTDAIAAEDFRASTYSESGGLTAAEVREALTIIASRGNVAAMEVTTFNPALDPDGSAAKALIEVVSAVLGARLTALEKAASAAAPPSPSAEEKAPQDDKTAESAEAATAGEPAPPPSATPSEFIPPESSPPGPEAWSSDSLGPDESADAAHSSAGDSSATDSGAADSETETSASADDDINPNDNPDPHDDGSPVG